MSKVIGVVHTDLNGAGGAELLSLTLAEALKEAGYKVKYVTWRRTDWEYVGRILGVEFRPDEEVVVPRFRGRVRAFSIYWGLVDQLLVRPRGVSLVINSLPGYMPLALRLDGRVRVVEFSFFDELFKGVGEGVVGLGSRRLEVLAVNPLSGEYGFYRVRYVVRRWFKGCLVRVRCRGGVVDVTPNHSLFTYSEDEGVLLTDARLVREGDQLVTLPGLSRGLDYSVKLVEEGSCGVATSRVVDVERVPYEGYVYDVSVERVECFFAGTLPALCHNTHGDVMPLVAADITYVHCPTFPLWCSNPANAKYLRSTLGRAYSTPYAHLWARALRRSLERTVLVTNSRYSRGIIEELLGRRAVVVYPPVRLASYLPLSRCRNREDLVVTISRFSPTKRLDEVLKVASRVRRAKFIIMGSTRLRAGLSYLGELRRAAKDMGLDNVKFMPDAPHEVKLEVLARAKVLLHCMRHEHFGIAPVEGMASGCVPVVHMSGGPWMDVLGCGQGVHGFAYKSVEEAAQYVEELLEDERMRLEIVRRNLAYVHRFSSDSFKRRMLHVVNRVAEEPPRGH